MLSIELFDSKFEKRLHEGAVDNTIAHLIDPLSRRAAEIRTQIRGGKLSGAELAKLEKEYEQLVQKRVDIMLGRESKTEQQQPPAKGLLKGKDLVTPQQRVAGATPSKPGLGAAVKDVAGGVKRWLKGEPDKGPTYEQQQQQSPRAYGVANFQRLVKANMGNYPKLELEFANAKDNIKLDKNGLDLISDYYDGLATDQDKNYFIYRVLPSGAETRKVLKSLGWQEQQQQELPGIPTQGELPLSEKTVQKKKSEDDLRSGDVKVARELQNLRAKYPAARSDVEAVARAEIDSSERSQQQLAAIKGANEKQDALLKQLVALDQEQGKEIDQLDQENDNLEQQLAQVQSTNDRLQQTIGQMTGTKKSAKAKSQTATSTATKSINLLPDAPVDQPSQPEPKAKTSPAMAAMARQLKGFQQPAPSVTKPDVEPDADVKSKEKQDDFEKPASLKSLRPATAANVDDFRLVGEGWSDRHNPTPYGVYIDGRQWKVFPTDDQARAVANKVIANLKRQGRDQKVTIGPSQEWLKGDNVKEGKEIVSKDDFVSERDRLLRMITQETNPVNKQILKSAIRQLENRAEAEGWITIQNRMVREDSDSGEAVEMAIMRRMLVAHTDLIVKFGLDKVVQAIEEVAYNVGDVDEIGTSDVSAYVAQVKQILGVPEELDEKWSAKYKKSINCANPKGFSQRAHCAGRKKK